MTAMTVYIAALGRHGQWPQWVVFNGGIGIWRDAEIDLMAASRPQQKC